VSQILRNLPRIDVLGTYLLFPTVQWIGDTPNGRRLSPLFAWGVRHLAAIVAGAAGLLPHALSARIVQLFVGDHPDIIDAALALCSYRTSHNALFMAGHEMREIRELDQEHVEKARDDIHLSRSHSRALTRCRPSSTSTTSGGTSERQTCGRRSATTRMSSAASPTPRSASILTATI
jgi:hypothetical protein